MNNPRLFADAPPELCDWTLPDDAVHKGRMTDCLAAPGHDGPHLVGHAQNGWARVYSVDQDAGTLTEVVHAMLRDGEQPSRTDLVLLLNGAADHAGQAAMIAIVLIVVALVILMFMLGLCVVAGQADRALERQRRERRGP